MNKKILFFLVLHILLINYCWANCSKQEASKAEENVTSLHSWSAVYKSFKEYSGCDDGAIAEGYSDSITKILASNWGDTKKLYSYIKNDKKFEKFVLYHIDETVPPEIIDKILSHTQNKCKKDIKYLCKNIENKIMSLKKAK